MNRKFIAKSNFVLRRVLNSEENIDILKEIIESILDIKIKEAKINPYLEKLFITLFSLHYYCFD